MVLPGTQEPDWLRNIMTTWWGRQRKLFPKNEIANSPKAYCFWLWLDCTSCVLYHQTKVLERNPSVSLWAQRTNDLGSYPTSILWNSSPRFHLSEMGGNSLCLERLFQKEANHTEPRTNSAGHAHSRASTSCVSPCLPTIELNARCYSTVVSPTANTNPKLMAFVLFGKHRTEGGVTARIKIGRLPKKFHKLLGNEMSSHVRSAFQCGNYCWKTLWTLPPFTGHRSPQARPLPIAPLNSPSQITALTSQTPFPNTTSAATGTLLEKLLTPLSAIAKASRWPRSSHPNQGIPEPSLSHGFKPASLHREEK